LQEVGGADSIGPVLLGLNKPVHVLQLGSSIRSIFNMVLIAVVDAQLKCKTNTQEVVKKSKWWKSSVKPAMIYNFGFWILDFRFAHTAFVVLSEI